MAVTGSDAPVKLAIAGASGRMPRMLIEAALAVGTGCALSGVLVRPGSPLVGADAGAALGRTTGVAITDDPHTALAEAQVLIDFTRPEATLALLPVCAERGVRLVIGTTGFTPEHKARIATHAERHACVLSANMSVGVNVMVELLAQAARTLGDGYDIEVVEAHHKHKVDAPSGTALMMGEALARARGVALATHGVFAREGHTGPRAPGSIGFATVRGGDIVGEHTVLFCGSGERIEIAHKSSSRANYAEGSLRAARFLAALPPGRGGLYDMADVLGLRRS
jgi:4-hydroxy-tetrahydrodipicolinate reductase